MRTIAIHCISKLAPVASVPVKFPHKQISSKISMTMWLGVNSFVASAFYMDALAVDANVPVSGESCKYRCLRINDFYKTRQKTNSHQPCPRDCGLLQRTPGKWSLPPELCIEGTALEQFFKVTKALKGWLGMQAVRGPDS